MLGVDESAMLDGTEGNLTNGEDCERLTVGLAPWVPDGRFPRAI